LPYFTKEVLRVAANRLGMKAGTFNAYINRSLRDGQIIHLKRGHYVTRVFYNANKTKISYLFFMANTLLRPSYISLETALSYYGMFAEAVNTITSVTIQLPRKFENRTGLYFYRNITEKLFTDFMVVKNDFDFVIALPHKAVFDYLYYYTKGFTQNVHPHLLEDLRIDTDELSDDDKQKLSACIAVFTNVKLYL